MIIQPTLPKQELEQLVRVPVYEWPALASRWLHDGLYSRELELFAALASPQAALAHADDMLAVLRSLGVPVTVTSDIRSHIFQISGFAARCAAAIQPTADDLRHTIGRYDLKPYVGLAYFDAPLIAHIALLPDLDSTSSGQGLTPDQSQPELVATAAAAVSDIFEMEFERSWPQCAEHQERLAPHPPPLTSPPAGGAAATWWCPAGGRHLIAPIGQLNPLNTIAQPNPRWADA